MDQDQNSSMSEVAPQDQESAAVETHESNNEVSASNERHELEEKQEKNWQAMRRKQQESELKLKAQEEMIEKLLKLQTPKEPSAPVVDEFAGIAPDDYPTWDLTEKRINKRAEEIAERKYRELESRKESERFLERLNSKYSDFQDVVNPDSIALFEEKEPELASTIAELKDPYKMGLQTYKYLKGMNLAGETSEKRHAKEVVKKLEANEKTVQTPQAHDKRPMAKAFKMDSSEMTALYEEMMGHAARSGFSY